MDKVEEWQSRPLKKFYTFLFVDYKALYLRITELYKKWNYRPAPNWAMVLMRAFTPLFVRFTELILFKKGNINVDDLTYTTRNGRVCWNEIKLRETGIKAVMDDWYANKGGFLGKNVSSDHIVALISAYVKDEGIINTVKNLRDVETHIRNKAAHTMIAISDEMFIDEQIR